ncbi:hypothetical protein ACFYZ9_38050 [Streptomyces sp. NPDC001691]|uniref:hypothetical protein n=1 Tax=Streptomyces sp. NPDC001691 TaxID=3364600 RepID=UPI0036C13E58
MPRPARHPRRPRSLGAPGAVLVGTLLTLSSGCSAPTAGAPTRPDASAPAVEPATPVSYGLPQDVMPMVLPTGGADTRLTQGLEGFTSLIRSETVRACFTSAHAKLPDAPPAMFVRLYEIPDLETIAHNGFAPATVPGQQLSPAGGAAPDNALVQSCGQKGDAAAAELQSVYGPLFSRWLGGLAPLETQDTVVSARKTFTGCLADKGVRAKDENDFFNGVDKKIQAIDDRDAMKAEDRRLGAIYATCMKPVEAAREPLRAKAREQYVAEHKDELAQIRTSLPERVATMEKRYGIRFSVPTPAGH